MTRPEASEQLSAYLDGELTDAESAAIEAELAIDASLRAELDDLEGVVQFLRQEGPSSPSMGFHARLMAAVEAEAPEPVSWWAWIRRPFGVPIEGLAVAAAAAAVLLLAIPRGDDPSGRDGWAEGPGEGVVAPAAVKAPSLDRKGVDSKDAELSPTAPTTKKVPQTVDKGLPTAETTGKAPKLADAAGSADAVDKTRVEPSTADSLRGSSGKDGAVPSDLSTQAAAPAPQAAPAPSPSQQTRGTSGPESQMVAAPNRYDLRADDPEVLRALLASIDRVGGTVSEGGASGVMTESREQLMVELPQEALTEFDRELRRLGLGVDRHFDDTRLYGAGATVPVQLTLTLEGGATTSPATAPNASRRSQKALDFADEALEADVDVQEQSVE